MGVHLEQNEIEATNRIMQIVNKIIADNPDVKCWICPKCRGTGLSSKQGDLYWDGLFCEECKGYSKRIEKVANYEKCTKCKGSGRIGNNICSKCQGYAHLDWLENIYGFRNKR
jgi:DnaJ-class molecular chaperone